MKKILQKISGAAIAVTLSTTVANAGHLGGELLISGKLTGSQEVPSVTTNATGVASFFLNSTWDSLFVNINATNLTGSITGIHVHEADAGANGSVVTNLTPYVKGNQVKAVLTGSDLTSEMISKYLSGKYYVNLHTATNPNGEIRAQLGLETDWGFRATLDTAQQNHSVANDAWGVAYFNVSHDKGMLEVKLAADGLSGSITGAHLHYGKAGVDGGVAVDLSSYISGNTIVGDIDISSMSGLVDSLMAGSVYVNLHTSANAAGEIRGQLWLDNRITFDSWLNTAQQTTPPVGTSATGAAYLSLNTTLDTLWYEVQAQSLSGVITGAHLHQAAVGADGGVLLDLSANISGSRISGMATGAAITTALVQSLLEGEVYVNLHTAANAAGEIRGQVYRLAREGYTISLEGNQQVPKIFAQAKGGGLVSIDRNQSNAHYMIVANGLTGVITGAHFHNAVEGENGSVLYDLSSAFGGVSTEDAAFGYWKSSDSSPFTTASSVEFRSDNVYVNVHTAANASGEIRGQVLRGAVEHMHQEVDNGSQVSDPMFGGGILFTAKFTGDQSVPVVATSATGVGGFLLNESMDTIWVDINLDGLSGPITGAHVHEGAKGVSGSVVTDLSSMITENQISGYITGFDLQKYIEGEYYVNIHTSAYPNGEVRGQIAFESEWMFKADMTGDQEVPAVTTSAKGLGAFNLSQDNSSLEIKVVVSGLSGAITGAHLHNAAIGASGGVVANLSTSVKDNYIVATIDPSAFLTELKNGEIYLNIHTASNPNGEIRGQLELAKAFTIDGWLNGAQLSPEAESPAVGVVTMWFNSTWDSLYYDVQLDMLSGSASAAHIHSGTLGNSGSVLVDLTSGINGNRINGAITGSALTANLKSAIINGETYINVHTAAFPNGETRGQLYRLAASGYSFDICGDQQSPALAVNAYGGGVLSINRQNSKSHLMFTTTDLSGAITGAHLHNEAKGNNGGVLTDLSSLLSGNSSFSYMAIDSAFASEVKNGRVYLNIHTVAQAAGEVRGQIDNVDDCPSPSSNTSVSQFNNDLVMSIYPNPVEEQLTVRFEKQNVSAILQLIDIYGNVVYIRQIDSTNSSEVIDMVDYTPGVYFVKAMIGTEVSTQSFVKI